MGTLEQEIKVLRKEKEGLEDVAAEASNMVAEPAKWKTETEQWTDSIYCIAYHLLELAGSDKGTMEGVQQPTWRCSFVEGQGLSEFEMS